MEREEETPFFSLLGEASLGTRLARARLVAQRPGTDRNGGEWRGRGEEGEEPSVDRVCIIVKG